MKTNQFHTDYWFLKNQTILGKRLKHLRSKHRVTQEELAFRARITVSYLAKIEKGQTNTTVRYLAKISRALEVPLYRLFE
ncbi:helix-turn-helix transcriptional regulator [Candidatus Roizmanbacteria bacterium]|nr:helix-turn-helix transcriptional regulator [Candidatus Roizmanbacteria bacterium]